MASKAPGIRREADTHPPLSASEAASLLMPGLRPLTPDLGDSAFLWLQPFYPFGPSRGDTACC